MKKNKTLARTSSRNTKESPKSSLKLRSSVKLINITKRRKLRRKRQRQHKPKLFSSKKFTSSYRLLINKNKRKKLRKKKQAVLLLKKITKLMSPPNYYARKPGNRHPPPPLPQPQSPDFQLCQLCSKIYRTEHLALHQQAYHPPPSPDTSCPLCRSSSKSTKFETVRGLFFHFLKLHLPPNLSNYFNQADKAKVSKFEPYVPFEVEPKKRGGRKKGQGKFTKKGVTCPECGKGLAGDLKRHMARIHGKGTAAVISYSCTVEKCKVEANSVAGIRKHLYGTHLNLWREKIRRWFEGGNFECQFCGWRGGDKWECMVHFILAHGNKLEGEEEGNLNCGKVKCPVEDCGEMGGDKEVMRRHVEFIHGGKGEEGWRCPWREECGGKVILNQEDLEEHWGKVHGCKEAYLLRQQGKMIRRVKMAGKIRNLFKNKVCFVKVERVNFNGS